ncbi:MAG: type II toxin-antitoxin system VapC family toxin [Deltaproteobacteria bacterium]|nr:type II toxin-antitoxin system VapC family toxin [Deltaproteobacteria bacterium]
MLYLLDTDICIYILNGGNERLKQRFRQCRTPDIGISAITEAELYYGALHSGHAEKNRDRVRAFLTPFTLCSFDSGAARHFAEMKQALTTKGQPIGIMDLLIAAVARALGLTVVTNNVKHFTRVPGLLVENWST